MARPGISYEDVKKAAVAIHQQGTPPSIQRVREWLGTGSNSTIAEHLRRWQQDLADTPQLALPPAVPDAVLEALESFWQVAMAQAQGNFEKESEQAQLAVAKADQERANALTEKHKAEEEANQLHEKLNRLQKTVRQLQDNLLIEQERRSAAENATSAVQRQVEAALQTADKVRQESAERILQLEKHLDQERRDHGQGLAQAEQRLVAERERGEATESRLMQLLDQQRNDFTQAQRRFDQKQAAWRTKENQLNAKLGNQQHDITQAQLRLAGTQERNTLLETELKEQRRNRQLLESHNLEAVQEIERLRGKLALATVEKQQLIEKLAVCQAALDDAHRQAATNNSEQAKSPSSP